MPSETNPSITNRNEAHIVHTPDPDQAVGRLFLFIPGTTAIPFYSRELLAEAADLGYHVIGLTYPNLESLNRDLCPGVADSACFLDARWEILTGEPTFDGLDVDRANSIEGRLESLLAYLVADEMKRYEYEITPNGNITYNAPGGYHDDCVIALALANSERYQFKWSGAIRLVAAAPRVPRLRARGRALVG